MTLADILTSRGHTLIKASASRWRLKCPIHGENTASAYLGTYRDGKQRLHCFGCGFHGDAYDVLIALGETPRTAMELTEGSRRPGDAHLAGQKAPGNAMVLACARPGCTSTVELRDRTYRTVGKHGREYDVRAVADLTQVALGWEVAPDLSAAVCVDCIVRSEAA